MPRVRWEEQLCVSCEFVTINWPIFRRFSVILLLCGSSAVVKRQRGGACRGAAMCGDRSHRLADGDTFPADDVLTPVPDRSRGDRRSGYLWGTRARAADVSGQHSGGLRLGVSLPALMQLLGHKDSISVAKECLKRCGVT
jgi:hypothetical protein